uniref:DDE Tnp4 domain-containing protein n=1 Tax=Chenopodium quinoa TaxID=63459 RepID=A0A803LJG9_CHEQI
NCLGALDGTYINVNVPSQERPKYRTRKGTIAMNVLGVCAPNLQFIYVLPGWEGSAHDMRVLRNALSRPDDFRVPQETYVKDKATGDVSESFVDAIEDIDQEIDKQPLIAESDGEDIVNSTHSETYSSTSQSGERAMKIEDDHITPSKMEKVKAFTIRSSASDSTTQSGKRSIKAKEVKIKGKNKVNLKILCRDNDDLVAFLHDVSNNFGKIFGNINVNLGTMASAWSKAEEREQRMDEKVNKVLDEVMKLDGISPFKALEVATILMEEEHKLHIFYQAPFNMKKQYAIDLLTKKYHLVVCYYVRNLSEKMMANDNP